MDDKPINILLVEDESLDVKIFKQRLVGSDNSKSDSFQIEDVNRLTSALKRLREPNRGMFDLIVADLNLPDSNGMETVTSLQKQANGVPIVVLTGLIDETLALDMAKNGVKDYLVKTELGQASLIRTLQYAVGRHQLEEEREKIHTELERLILIDPLTELFNRRGVEKALKRELEWCRRTHTTLLGLLVDLDNFKQANDTYGYSFGDFVLKEVAQELAESLRATDYVGRIGGDEFLVLLPQTDISNGLKVAERIRLAISQTPISHAESSLTVTASIGLADITGSSPSIEEVVAKVYPLLAHSKSEGNNRVSFAKDRQETISNGADLRPEILNAFKTSNSFYTVKQPIFSFAGSLKEVGYEFLSRSNETFFQMPEHFFRVCTEQNILTLVDHFCLKNCIAASKPFDSGVGLHINLYPSTLLEIPIELVLEELSAGGEKKNYCIELGEGLIFGDPAKLIEPIRALRKAGIKVALDDVGFGRTRLESLLALEPDVIKIDQKLVIGIRDNKGQLVSVKRLLKVAASLEAEVIAEGIETEKDLNVLKDLGVKYGQGFLWGKPA